MEAESRLPRGSCEVTPETASEMLRAAYQLLQVTHQLLQQGQLVQGSRVEGAVKKVDRVTVACQTVPDNENPEGAGCVSVACQTELEPEDTDVSEASWGVARLKARLEEEIEAHNDSSGYGSDVFFLYEEGNGASHRFFWLWL